jgi:membrane peptidoglycan carboxypeptidase
MAAQVESVVTTLNVNHLDFDIESNEQYDNADLALTAQALDQVRSWASGNGEQLSISYTIPVLPTGLTSTGENVLTTALANGFTPNVVNLMTMDYGTSGTEMGAAANQALDATAGQLESIAEAAEAAAHQPRPRPPRQRQRRPVRARPPGATTSRTSRATRSPTTAPTGSPTSGTTTRSPAARPAPGTTTAPADRLKPPRIERSTCARCPQPPARRPGATGQPGRGEDTRSA